MLRPTCWACSHSFRVRLVCVASSTRRLERRVFVCCQNFLCERGAEVALASTADSSSAWSYFALKMAEFACSEPSAVIGGGSVLAGSKS